MFDTKFVHIESKLEELIDNKLSKKMDENSTLMENTKERNHASPTTSLEEKSHSDALKDPKDFRQIMHEAINEERIEEREKEKRCNNFIIHGLAEKGKDTAALKENDTKVIAHFLEQIGIESEPESFTRLGKVNEGKNRTLKIVMKNKQVKERVLRNLNRLKDTVEEFGRISVTDDYTNSEREEIKNWIKKAQEKVPKTRKKYLKSEEIQKTGCAGWFSSKRKPTAIKNIEY